MERLGIGAVSGGHWPPKRVWFPELRYHYDDLAIILIQQGVEQPNHFFIRLEYCAGVH